MNLDLSTLAPYALVIITGLFAHACYALTLSMLTLVNSHAIGTSAKHNTVLKFSLSYICGSILATLGLLSTLTFIFSDLLSGQYAGFGWIIVSTLAIVVGGLTLVFYYRRGKGTKLWLPRPVIEAISARAKKTSRSLHAFGLGVSMVVLELPFLIAPLAVAGAVLATLPTIERTVGILAYTLAAITPLIVVTILIGGGYRLSAIQRWRETNKKFLQWTSGSALILIGVYLFSMTIWGSV